MIFVSGIHGVGKTYFCNLIKEEIGIKSYSSSQLIAEKRNKEFSADKLVSDIADNQVLLVKAIEELRENKEEFILDGHFCLLNTCGEIIRISYDIFQLLRPDTIVLLTETPDIIAERRFQRDGIVEDISVINAFQTAEKKYASEIAEQFGISFYMSTGAGDLKRIIEIIEMGGY